MVRLSELLREGRLRLAAVSDEAELEAEMLLRHVLGDVDRAELYARLADEALEDAAAEYERLLERRLAHEPTAYIIGRREFFGLEFEVTAAVLIPRPETETLVELAVALVRERYFEREVTIVDVGAGSGAIAVALAHELPNARVIATDTSVEALAVARRNAEHNGVSDRIEFREGDLLAPVTERVDVICANLPYVTTAQWEAMPPEIREWEPRSALDGGEDGLDVVRRLFHHPPAPSPVRGRGGEGLAALFCEIGDWQGSAVREMAEGAFPGARVEVHRDLAGRDRVVGVYL